MWRLSLGVGLALVLAGCGREAEGEIRQKTEQYTEAFNRHDSQAMANFWAEDATYKNPRTGTVTNGRKAIQEHFEAFFKGTKEAKLKTRIDTLSFQGPDKAEETGVSTLTLPGKPPQELRYKVFFEKREGQWLLTEVAEVDVEKASSNYEQLKAVDWLLGNWEDKDEDSNIERKAVWDTHKNFITERFSVYALGHLDYEGQQIIAWDPAQKQIRSWIYDSDGGFGEALWSKVGQEWQVDTTYTLPDGRKASAIYLYTDIKPDSYTWQATGRVVGGELLPNIDPVTVVKKGVI